MRRRKFTSAHIGLLSLLVCGCMAFGSNCLAQTVASESSPVKLDEYGDLPSDDEAAHLDLFAGKLFQQPRFRGYIMAYCEPRVGRGFYLRRIHGIGRYLTEARGIEPHRIVVVDGGHKEKFETQLWLVPVGAEPPVPAPTISQPSRITSSAYKFDEECLNCAPAVNLHLFGLGEGLKFYAEELREQPDSRGLLIARPDSNVSVREALSEARSAKSLLVKNYGIDANRIIIKSGRGRNDGTAVVEMWIVPRGAKRPTARLTKAYARPRLSSDVIENSAVAQLNARRVMPGNCHAIRRLNFKRRMRVRDQRQKRDLHALNSDGMVVCNPRDKEAAHRAEMEGIATEDRAAVTCRKCLSALYERDRVRDEGP